MIKDLKISIITPSFNSGKYIERAIKSVLDQNYKNFEHIIIDGGSTDNTVNILKKYKHLKWISEPDNGQADAMNKGFKKSSGGIIVYLNADDYFFPDAFSTVIEEFKKGANFVVGNILIKSLRMESEYINTPRITLEGMLRHWEPNAFCHNPVGYFYTRKVQELCPFNINNYDAMDLEFLLDAVSKFTFVKVEKILGCFEDGKETKTGKTQSKLDYWQPGMFPYLEKHINHLPTERKIIYENDRRSGYSKLQAHMNMLNRDSFESFPIKNLPLISVIIPTYNCGNYVCRAIDSILVQGLKNIEILVVDDASTDNTKEIISKYYKNDYIKVITHSKNKKLGAARNTGIDTAKGKYLFFLDADDWLENNSLIHLLTIAEKYNSEIVSCGVDKVWEDGKSELYHSEAFSCKGGKEALHHLSNYRIGSIVWNKIYLRDFIEENKLRFTVSYWHEDVMFTTRAIYLCKKYISISDTYYKYFQREMSILSSKKTELHLKSYLRLYIDMIEFIEKNKICDVEDGDYLSYNLLRSHCTYEIFPRLIDYIKTRTSLEWEKECLVACKDMLGVKGYALASFMIEAMRDRGEYKITGNKPLDAFSFKRIIKKHFSGIIHGKFRQPLKKIYHILRLNKIIK